MPTVLRIGPYRFYFFAGDRDEPPHIHVARDADSAKFWLDPVLLADNHGFVPHELRKIGKLIDEHHAQLLELWHEYFGN